MKYTTTTIFLLLISVLGYSQLRLTSTDVALLKEVVVKDYAGKEFSLSADIKSLPADSTGGAMIKLVEIEKNDGEFLTNSGKGQVADTAAKDWKKYTVTGIIDPKADKFWVYFYTQGNGDFYFDNLSLKVKDEKSEWITVPVENGDFEKSGNNALKGLKNIESVKRNKNVNTSLAVSNDQAYSKSLLISARNSVVSYKTIYGYNTKAGNFINVGGTNIYYETYGEGEPLLLLHGNGGSINSFSNQIPEFAKKYKVIAVDTRGQGKSTDITTKNFSYNLFAEDMKILLDSLGIKQVSIVGWSDGGNTGLTLAKKYPGYVKNLVVMGANLNPTEAAVSKKILNELKRDIKKLKAMNDPREDVIIRLLEMMLNEPNINPEELKAITAKTLVLAGEKDLIVEEHTKLIAQSIPGAELQIFKGESHFVVEENPAVFTAAVLKFLSGE